MVNLFQEKQLSDIGKSCSEKITGSQLNKCYEKKINYKKNYKCNIFAFETHKRVKS